MAKPPDSGPGSVRFALRACSPGLAVTIPFAGDPNLQAFQCVAPRPWYVLIFRITTLGGICTPTAAPRSVLAGDRDTHTPAAGHPPFLRPWLCQRRCGLGVRTPVLGSTFKRLFGQPHYGAFSIGENLATYMVARHIDDTNGDGGVTMTIVRLLVAV